MISSNARKRKGETRKCEPLLLFLIACKREPKVSEAREESKKENYSRFWSLELDEDS